MVSVVHWDDSALLVTESPPARTVPRRVPGYSGSDAETRSHGGGLRRSETARRVRSLPELLVPPPGLLRGTEPCAGRAARGRLRACPRPAHAARRPGACAPHPDWFAAPSEGAAARAWRTRRRSRSERQR